MFQLPTIPENNTYAIGDIHGCLDALKLLIESLPLNENSLLIFLGDYIDRGPDSKGVIDYLVEVNKKYTCHFLLGNHERLLLDFLHKRELSPWMVNGGRQTLNSYHSSEIEFKLPTEHLFFLSNCHMFIDTPTYFFVHGGIKPDMKIEKVVKEADFEYMLWERSHIKAPKYKWEKTVVCGHTPLRKIINHERLIAIDTGCVYHQEGLGLLTAIQLPSRKIYQIKNPTLNK